MSLHKINKGLELPISGAPEQRIDEARTPARVAILADDYVGMKPTMQVALGDEVRRGQLLFVDKKTPGVRFTSPASGRVSAIHRGERRAFQSMVVELDQGELAGSGESVSFDSYSGKHPSELSREDVRELLLESGLWTSLRVRPMSRVANPAETPFAIFVTASDTNPLAASADVVLAGKEAHFARGVEAIGKLTDGAVYVCKSSGGAAVAPTGEKFRLEEFTGPHPSGTVGVHIHALAPVSRQREVWHLNYQDAIAIGKLFGDGRLDVERVISLAGPVVERPRLIRTRLGASADALVERELKPGENRVISGSVLSGRAAMGETFGYLGRYHSQISAVKEGREREFLGWMGPGAGVYSVISVFASKLIPGKKFDFTTTTNGSDRAMVPIGLYERVFPIDIPPTFLLRALLMADVERSEELGCLELDEEDLALCSFVCPGKADYGPLLRKVLTMIEKEG